LLSGKWVGVGNVSASVPLGVTLSFLISAPMVNEVALALLFGMFGWNVPRLYLGLGLFVAIISGLVIGKLKMERHPEDLVVVAGRRSRAHTGVYQRGGYHSHR
jgi:uncharacterized membrane protein YraQ (UPF0718 family)